MKRTKTLLSTAALKLSMAMTLVPAAVISAKCDTDVGGLVKKIADVIVGIFPYIGVFFILSGVFKLIQAYRTDQPENQAVAAKDIVIGAVFTGFGTIVWDKISGLIVFK